jgi:hypothetical protein
MVVCPLCEHSQASGTDCEVCGRPFPGQLEAAADVAPLEGLEPTFAAPVQGEETAPVIPDLEVTSHAPVGAAVTDPMPDLEPTPAAPVDVSVAQIDGLDHGLDGLPDDEPTPFPALVVCRYCRAEAALGERICARCGMRLPSVALVPAPQAIEGGGERMCSCGLPIRGPRCPSCGARTPIP